MAEVVAGLDIGTSSIKLVLYHLENGVVYTNRKDHTKQNLFPSELNPEFLYQDVMSILREAIINNPHVKLKAIGLSTFFPSCIALDQNNQPLTQLITWLDSRGSEFVAEAKENQEFALELQAETGCVLHESYTIWKLLWLKKYQPQVFQKAYKFLSLADYLTYRLTGEFATSYAIASTTGLFNINSLTWDSSILEFLGISQSQLASCFEITHTEKISSKTMHELGFEEDLLLVLGAGDGPLSNLGTGCFSNAKMCSSVGTSSALRIMANSEANHSSVWKYYFDEQSYISGIAINAGFSSLFWVYQNIFQEDAAHILSDLQELDLDAMNEIIFLPFLDGERGPNYQQNMAGSFWGLKSNHGKKDILKAVVEGIFFNLYQCYQIIIEKKNLPSEIVAAGGYVNSAAMLQMQADIFNVKIVVPTIQEASAVGAAIVSLKGMGVISSLSSIKTVSKNLCIPNSAKHQEYMVKYKKYKKIYNMTLNILKEI